MTDELHQGQGINSRSIMQWNVIMALLTKDRALPTWKASSGPQKHLCSK